MTHILLGHGWGPALCKVTLPTEKEAQVTCAECLRILALLKGLNGPNSTHRTTQV